MASASAWDLRGWKRWAAMGFGVEAQPGRDVCIGGPVVGGRLRGPILLKPDEAESLARALRNAARLARQDARDV